MPIYLVDFVLVVSFSLFLKWANKAFNKAILLVKIVLTVLNGRRRIFHLLKTDCPCMDCKEIGDRLGLSCIHKLIALADIFHVEISMFTDIKQKGKCNPVFKRKIIYRMYLSKTK